MDCSEHSPLRIVPHRGQVSEYNSKSPRSEYWAVLHEDVSWSYLANDPRHVRPHPTALSCDACSLSGCADILAREAPRYHVNKAAPRSSVKGLNVIPYRERREKAFILSGGKYSSGIGFPFDGTDGFPSEQLAPKYSSTSAREKCQLIHVLLLVPAWREPPSDALVDASLGVLHCGADHADDDGPDHGVGGGDHVPPPVTSEGDRRIGVAIDGVEHVTTA